MKTKWMARVRVILYIHCLVASSCVGLAVYALERRYASDWRFDSQLESFFANPAGTCLGWLWLLSFFLFPCLLAEETGGRLSEWRRWVIVIEDTLLGLVQLAALLVLIPVRY